MPRVNLRSQLACTEAGVRKSKPAIGEPVRYRGLGLSGLGSQYNREAVVRMYERSRTRRSAAARFDPLLRVWRLVLRSFEESGRPPHRKPDAISKSRRFTDGFPLTLTFDHRRRPGGTDI